MTLYKHQFCLLEAIYDNPIKYLFPCKRKYYFYIGVYIKEKDKCPFHHKAKGGKEIRFNTTVGYCVPHVYTMVQKGLNSFVGFFVLRYNTIYFLEK